MRYAEQTFNDRLADLVEPEPRRECYADEVDKPGLIPDAKFYICRRCGASFLCWEYDENYNEVAVLPVCCPKCNAKVIKHVK